jgi:hypothetical protein
MKKLFLLAIVGLLSCNQYYLKYSGDYGYSDLVNGDKIEVTYVGSSNMTITDSKKYAFYRIAHLAYLNNMKFVKITKEIVDENKTRVKQDAQTSQTEKTDSLGNKEYTTTSTPQIVTSIVKPIITVEGIGMNECDSNCIDVQKTIKKAELEGIKIIKQ